jgi:putative transposase
MSNRRLYQLDHCTWRCIFHLVWTPRYRGKVLADKYIKTELKRIFKLILQWKGFGLEGWHVGDEHIHLVLIIPPKYSVAYAVQVIKGKSSAWLKKKTKQFPPGPFWARGYFVSTIGLDEHQVRNYVANQQHHLRPLPTLFDKPGGKPG